jgi:hypothetical protein
MSAGGCGGAGGATALALGRGALALGGSLALGGGALASGGVGSRGAQAPRARHEITSARGSTASG